MPTTSNTPALPDQPLSHFGHYFAHPSSMQAPPDAQLSLSALHTSQRHDNNSQQTAVAVRQFPPKLGWPLNQQEVVASPRSPLRTAVPPQAPAVAPPSLRSQSHTLVCGVLTAPAEAPRAHAAGGPTASISKNIHCSQIQSTAKAVHASSPPKAARWQSSRHNPLFDRTGAERGVPSAEAGADQQQQQPPRKQRQQQQQGQPCVLQPAAPKRELPEAAPNDQSLGAAWLAATSQLCSSAAAEASAAASTAAGTSTPLTQAGAAAAAAARVLLLSLPFLVASQHQPTANTPPAAERAGHTGVAAGLLPAAKAGLPVASRLLQQQHKSAAAAAPATAASPGSISGGAQQSLRLSTLRVGAVVRLLELSQGTAEAAADAAHLLEWAAVASTGGSSALGQVPLSALLRPRALDAWLQQLSSSADSEAALRRLQSLQHVLELPAVAHCADLAARERQQLMQVLRAAKARVTSRQQDAGAHEAAQA